MGDRRGGYRIVVVGPCASGKSTLVRRLREMGYEAKECAQEHSGVPDLWKRFSKADLLVYLDVSLETIAARQGRGDWKERDLDEQRRRLAHARAHADLYLYTDDLTPEEICERVRAFLGEVCTSGDG